VEGQYFLTEAYGNGFATWIDDITPHSTATWNGTGTVRFSYHIIGSVDVDSSLSNLPSTPEPAATANVFFDCSRNGAPCFSPDFAPASPGAPQLVRRLTYTGPGTVDEIIDFEMPVQADVPFNYAIRMGPTANIRFASGEDVPIVFSAYAKANFESTGRLVDVTLIDAAGNIVSDARFSAASGTDYVNLIPVPEPNAAWMLLVGLVAVAASVRVTCPLLPYQSFSFCRKSVAKVN